MTAAAVELLPPDEARPDNPHWHAHRRRGIAASEIAAVVGISPWDSAFSLYWRKIEGWYIEPTEEMTTGSILEPAIADLWLERYDPHENLILARGGLYAHPSHTWQLATPDFTIHRVCSWCDGSGLIHDGMGAGPCQCGRERYPMGAAGPALAVLECKWTATWAGWGDDGTDQIPPHYRAQVLWQADVLGLSQWYLAALGPSGLRVYNGRIDRVAERDLALMRRAGAEFAERLASGDPPPVDDGHRATLQTLRRLHPSIEPGEVEMPAGFVDGWRRARALRKRAEQLCDRYEARARDALGDQHRLVCDGQLVASRSITEHHSDTAELDALDADRPTTDRLNPGKALTHG